jgi:uncharacterized integral membrane protein
MSSPEIADALVEPPTPVEGPAGELPGRRRARLAHRAGLYACSVLFIALLVAVIVLSAANARSVKLDWIAGSDSTSLVWIVVGATVVGWVLGITTCTLIRFRTRRRPAL